MNKRIASFTPQETDASKNETTKMKQENWQVF